MITQGWPLWAVSDEADGRGIYAIVGWEDWRPVGVMIGGEPGPHRTADPLPFPLAFFGDLGDARRAARKVAGS